MLGLNYGRLIAIAVSVCPDSFPVVHLVAGGQPVCMLEVAVWAVQLGLLWLMVLV